MHFSKLTTAAAVIGSAFAQSNGTSICDKYTTALLKENNAANQLTLLTLLVNTAVIGNYTGPGTSNPKLPGSMVDVPGILASDAKYLGMPVNLAQYFDGSLLSTNGGSKGVSKNFLDGGAAKPIIANATSSGTPGSNQYILLTHLYSYFGALLGCTQYGQGAFPAYAGSPGMFNVHRYMDLSETETSYFISQVGAAAQSFGASTSDIDAVAKSLNTTFGYKCSPEAQPLPNLPKQLQAICVGDGCPTATSGAVCSSYPAEARAAPASSTGSSSGSSSSSASGSSSTSSAASTTTSSGASSSSASGSGTAATSTSASKGGAAAMITAMPMAAAGVAGLVALAL